jgi:glyoxylase-like metal-dependent hydrolase (beta-lactamase superfamily II)
MLIEGLPLWFTETNAWIVAPDGPGGECVLIDAPPEPDLIIGRLAEHGLRLVALINTHGHLDHIGGVGAVVAAQENDVPVHIHDDDKHMLLDPIGTSGGFARMLGDIDVSPPELVYGLDDGQKVSGAGMTFTALHTPGHTQGSTCLLLEIDGQQVLFSGDHLFAGSIGRTDLPGGSYERLMESMAEKILPLDDDVPVLPGHGPTTTVGRERATNPFILELLADQRPASKLWTPEQRWG